jgi:hypothetical protein
MFFGKIGIVVSNANQQRLEELFEQALQRSGNKNLFNPSNPIVQFPR